MFIKIIILLIIALIIPFYVGLLVSQKTEKHKNSILYPWVVGIFSEFALFEILYFIVVVIFKAKSFAIISGIWIVVLIILSILSVVLNRKIYKDIFNSFYEGLDLITNLHICLAIFAFVLIVFQIYQSTSKVLNTIDYNKMILINTVAQTNTIKQYNQMGELEEASISLDDLSPFNYFISLYANISELHVSQIAYICMPIMFIIASYIIYWYLIKNIFDDKYKQLTCLILINVVNIFGYTSTFLPFYFISMWEGQSILAMMVIPFLMLNIVDYMDDEGLWIYIVTMVVTVISGMLMNVSAIVLLPIVITSLLIVYLIRDRIWMDIIKFIVLYVIIFVFLLIYLKFKV